MQLIKKSAAKKPAQLDRPKYNMWQNSAFMIARAWAQRRSVLWLCLILAGLAVAANLLGLYVTPTLLGAIESKLPLGSLMGMILAFAGALLAVGAATAYVNANTIFGRIEIRSKLTAAIHEKFMTMSFPLTGDPKVKKLQDKAMRAVGGNEEATEAVWNTITDILQNSIGFIVYFTLLTAMDPLLMGVVAGTACAGFLITKRLSGWGYRHREEEAEYTRRLEYIRTKAGNHTLAKDIRIFNMSGWLQDVYASTQSLYRAFIARGEKVYIWGNIADVVLTFARNGIAYLYLILAVLHGGMSAPQFLLYFSAIGGFTQWLTGILTGFETLHRQSLEISTVREFIEYPETFKFEEGAPLTPEPTRPYEIRLQNVSFRYPGSDADALTNVSLTIRAGEKLAVVGLNGAGKTTLVKLLCGFLDPTQGEVLLNGIPVTTLNRRDYYRHFSAVFQDFSVLPETIGRNISQTEEVDRIKARSCAERAGIAARIDRMPNAYETHIGKEVYEDGIELSGGELQRLMLARALYKDAPIIVLDEPTAALDPIAESEIYQRYNELIKGRTSIYISHRLASTRFCDRILLVKDRVISEEGTHDELMKRGGTYAQLYEIQSRYYREGGLEGEEEFENLQHSIA